MSSEENSNLSEEDGGGWEYYGNHSYLEHLKNNQTNSGSNSTINYTAEEFSDNNEEQPVSNEYFVEATLMKTTETLPEKSFVSLDSVILNKKSKEISEIQIIKTKENNFQTEQEMEIDNDIKEIIENVGIKKTIILGSTGIMEPVVLDEVEEIVNDLKKKNEQEPDMILKQCNSQQVTTETEGRGVETEDRNYLSEKSGTLVPDNGLKKKLEKHASEETPLLNNAEKCITYDQSQGDAVLVKTNPIKDVIEVTDKILARKEDVIKELKSKIPIRRSEIKKCNKPEEQPSHVNNDGTISSQSKSCLRKKSNKVEEVKSSGTIPLSKKSSYVGEGNKPNRKFLFSRKLNHELREKTEESNDPLPFTSKDSLKALPKKINKDEEEKIKKTKKNSLVSNKESMEIPTAQTCVQQIFSQKRNGDKDTEISKRWLTSGKILTYNPKIKAQMNEKSRNLQKKPQESISSAEKPMVSRKVLKPVPKTPQRMTTPTGFNEETHKASSLLNPEINYSVNISNAQSSIIGQSKRLSPLEARYRMQMKIYYAQLNDLSGISVRLDSTRNTLLSLGVQIEKLGGKVPILETEKTFTDLKDLQQKSTITKYFVSTNAEDKCLNTDAIIELECSKEIPDFLANQLKEENKQLTLDIERLKYDSSMQNTRFDKCLLEMKRLEESNQTTYVSCEDAVKQQGLLNIKLEEFRTTVEDLTSITKESSKYGPLTVKKLKEELKEEVLKLEMEKKSRCETENRIREELNNERGKLKVEKAKREALQYEYSSLCNDNASICKEISVLSGRVQELEELLDLQEISHLEANNKLQFLQRAINEKDEHIKNAESIISQLKESREKLENEVEKDLSERTSTSPSIVEMSNQLLNKDEQLRDLKIQLDQMINENGTLNELLHFTASMNYIDISSIIVEDVIHSPGSLLKIKEKIKEASRKPPSTITESLVREQAKQINEQAANIQSYGEELNKQREQVQELLSSISSKEKEISFLKAESSKYLEKLKIMENIEQQQQVSLEQINNSNKISDVGIVKGNDKSFDELLTRLVARGEALSRMETKMKQLELVHSMCARRRTRGESRIAHFESILMNDPTCWEEAIISN